MASGSNLLVNYKSERLASPDFRNVSPEPWTIESGIRTQFMSASASGISTDGSYVGVMKWRSYGSGTDLSGGPVKEIAYSNSRLFHRQSTSATAWSAWRTLVDIPYNTAVGSAVIPVYVNSSGQVVQCNYSINATINAGTATYMAYYSGANTISSTPNLYISSNTLHSTYKSSSWVNSLTNAALSLDDSAGSYGGWICGPTKDGRIAISTYQGNDNYIYLGYGERGRTANSFATSIRWDGPNNILYSNRQDMNWLRVINDSSNNSDDAVVYVQNQSSNDWALKINCSGYNYGIYVSTADGAGNAIQTNGVIIGYDIRASRYMYAQYYNASCGAEMPTSSSYWIYANSDGWFRKSTAANVQSSIGGYFLTRQAWWNSGDSHSVNDLRGGATFCYTSHSAPVAGTIVSFDCSTNNNYTLQIMGSYGSNYFYWRNRNGDNGTWNTWLTACAMIAENGYWGIKTPYGGNDWIRTTTYGIIPNQLGGYGSGHCGLGTSSWFFSYVYADNYYGNFRTQHGYINYGASNGGINMILTGDDAWIGDCNIAGTFGVKSNNSANAGISFYGSDGTYRGQLDFNSTYGCQCTTYMHVVSSPCSWIDGQRYVRCYSLTDATNMGSYWPWIRQTNTSSGRWFSFGHLNKSMYLMSSTTSRTDNGYDYALEWVGNTGHLYATAVHSAVWNDYAECRKADSKEPGRVVYEQKNGIMKLTDARLLPGCHIISDTYGMLIGETLEAKTPIGVSGRVLVYPYQDKENYELGAAVCSAPGGTVDIMTRDEIRNYPERIIGIVSEIPDYDIWMAGGNSTTDLSGEGGGHTSSLCGWQNLGIRAVTSLWQLEEVA